MTEYCCKEFEKAVYYDDFRYYRLEDSGHRPIKKAGWHLHNIQYDRLLASREPFKYCPLCSES